MTDYTLAHGAHATADDGMCLMEAVAWLAGESHSDRPACACPVLSGFGRRINDAMGKGPEGDELRARYLADLAPRLVGTRSTPEMERRRAVVLADHAVRSLAPLALDAVGLRDHAATMRDLAPITGRSNALSEAAATAAHAAAAYATEYAAHDAARSAAYAAARAAASSSCAHAAADVAYAAARVANPDAVWTAARDAFVAAIEVAP